MILELKRNKSLWCLLIGISQLLSFLCSCFFERWSYVVSTLRCYFEFGLIEISIEFRLWLVLFVSLSSSVDSVGKVHTCIQSKWLIKWAHSNLTIVLNGCKNVSRPNIFEQSQFQSPQHTKHTMHVTSTEFVDRGLSAQLENGICLSWKNWIGFVIVHEKSNYGSALLTERKTQTYSFDRSSAVCVTQQPNLVLSNELRHKIISSQPLYV